MEQNKRDTGGRAVGILSGVLPGAAGGPAGAAVGALFAEPGMALKGLAAAGFLRLLPVLFLLLLPSLIFGGFQDAHSPHDAAAPVLNSETAIVGIANELTLTVNGVLQEGLDDVRARMEADFAASGGDGMEIVNPYADNPRGNIAAFIAQYCAAKDRDFASVSVADLEQMLRAAKDRLYTYQRTEELRERIELVSAPETEEETEASDEEDSGEDVPMIETVIEEKWMIYTIAYNGEEYFADEVFHLSDEQKQLAEWYAQNLRLFLGDGLLQTPGGACESIPSLGNIRFTDGATPVVYYNQRDERYANAPYGTDNIGEYGCGPTCMAMVVSSLTGRTVDPIEMARWAYDNDYWINGGGSYHALIPGAAAHWGLPVSGCTASEPQRIVDALAGGKLVVAIMGAGHFTDSGHFIVLRGVQDGKILVADPYSVNYSNRLWDLSPIVGEASRNAAAGGPFWIIG